MSPADIARLLALITAYDHRTIGEADVAAWHHAIADFDPADCIQAIHDHYRDSVDWLMPAHVRTRVKAIRAQRLQGADRILDRLPVDNALEYLDALRQQRQQIASGHLDLSAVRTGTPQRALNDAEDLA